MRDAKLSHNSHSIWIGVLSSGIPFMGAPFMTCMCKTYPQINRRYIVLLGWAICVAGLVGASFCASLLSLTLTQGLLYGVGIFILDAPVLLILNTWFVKRRGFAYGILFSITDLLGFGFSILATALLRRHGLRWTLLTFAGIILLIPGPAILFLKPRPPEDKDVFCPETPLAIIKRCLYHARRYCRQHIFYLFTLSNILQALAFYLPFIYLPSYTTDLGHTPTQGAIVLGTANFAQIFGELGFGQLSDSVNVNILIIISSLVASISVLALWGLAQSLVQLVFFALVFGGFASGFISLWAGMGRTFGEESAQMVYSTLSFCRGVSSIVSGPISSSLLRGLPEHGSGHNHRHHAYGNRKYAWVVLFVGICMACSALLGGLGLLAGKQKNQDGNDTELTEKGNETPSAQSGLVV
jgi:MFS family permease